ncbi:hypothetical protein [Dactylosporangium sp. NPDC051484]|uniref:hypothetical protein n=1 Tax=Dactylosporangium sp. NPDC051484 TaxID=3154942 RepID=UPI00344D26B3
MTPTTVLPPVADRDLCVVAGPLASLTGLLLALDAPGCDGIDCSTPAFHDRSTGIWRHLRDLSRCSTDRPQRHDGAHSGTDLPGARP